MYIYTLFCQSHLQMKARGCFHLYVSVGEEQVHDDVLGQDLGVVHAELDAGQFLGQLLALVLLPGLPDVVQQRVLEGGAAKTHRQRLKMQ